MSLRDALAVTLLDVPEVTSCTVDKDAEFHGQAAVEVTVILADGRTVVGTFTTEAKSGFGGVEFASRKDIPALMRSKVDAVLRGTAEMTGTLAVSDDADHGELKS